MKSDDQIMEQINRLIAVKHKVPSHTGFGDDNHGAIDLQIKVLEHRMSENDIYTERPTPEMDELDGKEEDSVRDNALAAREWMVDDDCRGNADVEPAAGWEELAEIRAK
jgi:hypothetical protein